MTPPPPLLGDGRGVYRVSVVGNSGAGKTTLAKELAEILNVASIHIDELNWKPGWVASDRDELTAKVRAQLEAHDERGWVIDGNYESRTGGIVQEKATDVIWLDPPLLLYFPRLCIRTFLRLFKLVIPCAPGCYEMFSEVFFSKDSIIWWCLSRHWSTRRRHRPRMEQWGIHVGGNMRRIGGWGGELAEWKEEVRQFVRRE